MKATILYNNSFHQTHQIPIFPPVFRALGSSPWEILGVAPGATPAEVKKAYRRKALTHGPMKGVCEDHSRRFLVGGRNGN